MAKEYINNTGQLAWWIAKQDDDSIVRAWDCEDGTRTETGLDAIVGFTIYEDWLDELTALGVPSPPEGYEPPIE